MTRLAQWQERDLLLALAKLRALIDPADDKCTVHPEVKAAVRPYVSAYIIPLIAGVAAPPRSRRRPR